MTPTRACGACGAELPQQRRPANPRKWCSESCRLWALRNPGRVRERVACVLCELPVHRTGARLHSRCRDLLLHPPTPGLCPCGRSFIGRRSREYCSARCRARMKRIRRELQGLAPEPRPSDPAGNRERCRRKRARLRAARVLPYQRRDIFERDEWTCQICQEPVDPDVRSPHPLSATIDHVVALSAGGTDEPGNVQLAHRVCNTRKGRGAVDRLVIDRRR